MGNIIVYGTSWCGASKRAVRILDERKIIYDWIDITYDVKGEEFVKATNNGYKSVPTIVFPDNTILVEPSSQALIDKLESFGDEQEFS
jgi:mycoredoxin